MATRIQHPATAFALTGGMKRPRQAAPNHLRFVHGLPCLVCGKPGEAAHIRMGSVRHGRRGTGVGERPSDLWTVPLCPAHHREGPDAQHGANETAWWAAHGIDPFVVAALLWAHTGDLEAAMLVCENATSFGGLNDGKK